MHLSDTTRLALRLISAFVLNCRPVGVKNREHTSALLHVNRVGMFPIFKQPFLSSSDLHMFAIFYYYFDSVSGNPQNAMP